MANLASEISLVELKDLDKTCPNFCKLVLNSISANPIHDKLFALASSKNDIRFDFPQNGSIMVANTETHTMLNIKTRFTCYKYAFKFACFFQPDNKQLLEFILTKIDFKCTKIQPFLFEIACIIGTFLGVDHPKFVEIFNLSPWLMGE